MLNFNKRINGKTYYLRVVLSFVGILVLALIVDLLPDESTPGLVGFLCFIVLVLFWLVFMISQIRQRANDIGKHPLLLTVLSFWTPLYLILGFIPGEAKANKYGPAPK